MPAEIYVGFTILVVMLFAIVYLVLVGVFFAQSGDDIPGDAIVPVTTEDLHDGYRTLENRVRLPAVAIEAGHTWTGCIVDALEQFGVKKNRAQDIGRIASGLTIPICTLIVYLLGYIAGAN